MRLIIYIFLGCQILNFLSVFGEKFKEDSSEFNSVKWKKVEEDKYNAPKEIFWKSYKDDDSYTQEDRLKDDLSKTKKNFLDKKYQFIFEGLSVDNSIIPRKGQSSININFDSSGNLFGSFSYSLSNIFQLNLMNAGSFKAKNTILSKSSNLTNIFIGENNFHYRIGGKLLLFSPDKYDLFWLSSRVSLGRDLDSRNDYIYTDLTSTIKFNDWLTLNISPKYIFSGVGNLGAIGFSKNINLFNNLQFVAETNLGITKNSSDNSTFSLRYSYLPEKSIDVFATNAVGFQDIGSMLSTNDYKFGIRMNYIF